jgi:hypothetical protein
MTKQVPNMVEKAETVWETVTRTIPSAPSGAPGGGTPRGQSAGGGNRLWEHLPQFRNRGEVGAANHQSALRHLLLAQGGHHAPQTLDVDQATRNPLLGRLRQNRQGRTRHDERKGKEVHEKQISDLADNICIVGNDSLSAFHDNTNYCTDPSDSNN